jgi:hypothetical protein
MPTLLGEWGFLNNYDDTSGNGRHGAVTGTPIYTAGPTVSTKGLNFQHDGDSVSFGRTGLEPSLEGITVMGWVRVVGNPDISSNYILALMSKARATGSSRSRLGIWYDGPTNVRRRAAVARWKDDLHVDDAGTTTWTDDDWHHLAIVDGNTRYAFYVDGAEETSVSRSLGAGANTAWEDFPWITGNNPDLEDRGASPDFSVSGIRLFQGELTTTEINTWMNTPIMVVAPPAGPADFFAFF